MWIPCELYYEKFLGDCCDNDCEDCFGNKEVYECREDFEVCGETVLDKVVIRKGEWFWARFMNNDHVLLENGTNSMLTLKRNLFDKYFTDKFDI